LSSLQTAMLIGSDPQAVSKRKVKEVYKITVIFCT